MSASRPLLLGHRGISGRFPENSMTALREAVRSGAHGIEFDIQKGGDGNFYVTHDQNMQRCCGVDANIEAMSAKDVAALDCGDGFPPPELGVALEALGIEWKSRKNTPAITEEREKFIVNIELKDETLGGESWPADWARIHTLIGGFAEVFDMIISSFDHSLLDAPAADGYRCGLLISERHGREGMRTLGRSISRIRPWSMHLPVQLFAQTKPLTRALLFNWFRMKGLKLIFWTVNLQSDFDRLPKDSYAIIADDPFRIKLPS